MVLVDDIGVCRERGTSKNEGGDGSKEENFVYTILHKIGDRWIKLQLP
jgi:hypothetical protein